LYLVIEKSRIMTPVSTISVISILTLFSCGYAEKAGNESNQEVAVDKDFNYVEVNNEYSINLPSYMKKATSLNDEASLQYQNIFKEVYTIIIDESADEFIEVFKELNEYDENESILINYRRVQLSFISENMDLKDQSTPKPININGHDSELVSLEGNIDDVEIYYLLGFVQGKEKMYMIMTWTLLSRKDKYHKDLEDIITSFKILQ